MSTSPAHDAVGDGGRRPLWAKCRRILLAGCLLAGTVAVAGLAGSGVQMWRLRPESRCCLHPTAAGGANILCRERTVAATDLGGPLPTGLNSRRPLPAIASTGTRALRDARRRYTPPSDAALAITVYAADGTARAWTGRPSEISPGRLSGGSSVFVTPGPLGLATRGCRTGLRARQAPMKAPRRRRRIGAVAVEQVLSDATPARTARRRRISGSRPPSRRSRFAIPAAAVA